MSKQNVLFEGSKWKEKARKGELSQKSFDTLKNSNIGKKYLNPLNVIYNKRKGQKIEIEKLQKKIPSFDYYEYHYKLDDPINSCTGQHLMTGHPMMFLANPKNKRVKKISTPLQRELMKQHEMDEMIALVKSFENGDYEKLQNCKLRVTDTKYSKKLLNKIRENVKNKKYSFPIIGERKLLRDVSDYALAASGYSHMPGVLNKEFETRNLLYPSNKKTTKSKVFKRGKYTLTNKDKRDDPEIEYGKQKPDRRILFNKDDPWLKASRTFWGW